MKPPRISAEQRYQQAQKWLRPNNSPKKIALAIAYLHEAIQQGHIAAKTSLARCYATGLGVPEDFKKAFALYLEAAEADDLYALYQVGRYYKEGQAGVKNLSESFNYFLRAAKLGDEDAQGQVAMAYLRGEGVRKNIGEAVEWVNRSLQGRSAVGYWCKAHMYQTGEGVEEQNLGLAKYYLQESADAGFAPASLELTQLNQAPKVNQRHAPIPRAPHSSMQSTSSQQTDNVPLAFKLTTAALVVAGIIAALSQTPPAPPPTRARNSFCIIL